MHRSLVVAAVLLFSDLAYPSSPNITATVVSAAVPFYPPLARAARVQGEVVAEVVTSGETFSEIKILSGHPLLSAAVAVNLKTWIVVNAPPTTLKVTYRYKISEACKGKPLVTLNLPTNISICSPPLPPLN